MLKSALFDYLDLVKSDDQIVELFQRIKSLQSNGIQIREAIETACRLPDHEKIQVSKKALHMDNAPAFLAIRYRAKLIQYRDEGHGYGAISKMLAQRGGYNRLTKKAYSRTTIKRALELIEKGKK